jgi:hypothetical protein
LVVITLIFEELQGVQVLKSPPPWAEKKKQREAVLAALAFAYTLTFFSLLLYLTF